MTPFTLKNAGSAAPGDSVQTGQSKAGRLAGRLAGWLAGGRAGERAGWLAHTD